MKRKHKLTKTKNALEILNRQASDDAELQRMMAEERLNAVVAQLVYNARTEAGLTQAQLAKLVGTKQPAIARLEDADYPGGHSLVMLQRIAVALNKRLEINFFPAQHEPQSAWVRR